MPPNPFAEGRSRALERNMEDMKIQMVESTESPEFSEFKEAISHSSIIGMDAEWKPVRSHETIFPSVLLLQIACQLINNSSDEEEKQLKSNIVFLLDLSKIHLPSIYDMLKNVFINPYVIKLGFHFKQDLIYLSSTFRDHGCHSGFNMVVPYLDIANLNKTKSDKSLSSICHDLLGFPLSKELQCSDWSVRPLTDQQKTYAALDAFCLIQIFNVFLRNQGSFQNHAKLERSTYSEDVQMVVREYGDKIELTETNPRTSKKNGKERRVDGIDTLQGPAPWCPKFLCDLKLNVRGLVKCLRCVLVDVALPYSKEKRVLLTRKDWPLRQEYLLINPIYRVKSIQNFDQLKESSEIQIVDSTDSDEFRNFEWAISHSSIIGLASQWKSFRYLQPDTNFPPILLLQIACQLIINSSDEEQQQKSNSVFLLDLSKIHLPSIYDLLKNIFINPHVIKLGFHFKQDLIYLSSTFRDKGCHSGFDKVVSYVNIAIFNQTRMPKCDKSLSSICEDLFGFSLSKELLCSDWSVRPLTHQQKTYAALAARCLIQIFNVFLPRLLNQGSFLNHIKLDNSSFNRGLKHILRENERSAYPAVEMVQVVRKYGDKIELTETDRMPRTSKRKGKETWQGPTPWDPLLGGDGCPKFLCDPKVTGLEKQLRFVGVDAAFPDSKKKPEPSELIDQAIKEKRVLLIGEGWPLGKESQNQIYRVNSKRPSDQVKEVIETFQLNICKDQLMSRCIHCNGRRLIQKTLSKEEAIEVSKRFQDPNYLSDHNVETWQCIDCNHIYWQGHRYFAGVRRYMDVCKISSNA